MKMSMDGEKIMVECFLCEKKAQMGPHVYNIRHIPKWDIEVCDNCRKWNWDGLLPERNTRLVEYLNSRQIPIELNSSGWIAWPEGSLMPGDIPSVTRSKRR
jgi:hypothetical protein